MRAYDLEMAQVPADRNDPEHHGWVFGRPPGITAHQWPLHPQTGFPLMHGFTLRLPVDHRPHGPAIVALSFFAVTPDHTYGEPLVGVDLRRVLADHPDEAPADQDLAAIWTHAQVSHPRLHRMTDIINNSYAAILLTQDELDGPLCQIPELAYNPLFSDLPKARWLSRDTCPGTEGLGREAAYYSGASFPLEPDFHRAILCTPRERDPNAGVKAAVPVEDEDEYVWHYKPDSWDLYDWAESHLENHIGGTMMPKQEYPDFGVHYVEFEEYFGDYNFGGGGRAQLDFENMKFEWAH